jgi:hypothetical protein
LTHYAIDDIDIIDYATLLTHYCISHYYITPAIDITLMTPDAITPLAADYAISLH